MKDNVLVPISPNNIYINRKVISIIIKSLITIIVFLGFVLGLMVSKIDGYSHFSKRLLYFTTQSNLWIGVISFLTLIKPKSLSLRYAKFCFTVNIVMTGIVYCIFLAPFADQTYNVWSFYSILFHAIVPLLSLIDFFIDDFKLNLKFRHALICLIPPTIYYSLTLLLCFGKVDFGHGSPFPYFFMDVYSPAGLFGVDFSSRPYFGTIYWILFFASVMFLIAIFLVKIKTKPRRYVRSDRNLD